MKIGIDVRPLMNKNYSGVSWYIFNLLTNIFEIDKKNEYILFCNSSKNPKLPDFQRDNVSYKKFNYPNKFFNLSLLMFNHPKIDKLIGGVDVFVSLNFNFSALSNNCKKILVAHDFSFFRFPEFFSWRMKFWHWFLRSPQQIRSADLIIADSENTKNDLIDLFQIDKQKVKVSYLGVGENYKPITDLSKLAEIRRKYDLPDRFILSLCTLEPRKNLESVISAFANLNNYEGQLIIAGPQGWKSEKIKELSAQSKKIRIVGYIEERDKPTLYSLADLLVYPSYYEGFGLPPLEAMACGCPVIAGANSAQAEVVGQAGLLINPENVNEVGKAVELVLTDDAYRQKISQLGIERAKLFSWRKAAEIFLDNFNLI